MIRLYRPQSYIAPHNERGHKHSKDRHRNEVVRRHKPVLLHEFPGFPEKEHRGPHIGRGSKKHEPNQSLEPLHQGLAILIISLSHSEQVMIIKPSSGSNLAQVGFVGWHPECKYRGPCSSCVHSGLSHESPQRSSKLTTSVIFIFLLRENFYFCHF